MAVQITIEIETTGNAAFEDAPASEIARILRELAKRMEDGDFPEGDTPVRDINGNRCGSVFLADDGE